MGWHGISGRSGKIKVGQIGVGHAHASKLSAFRRSDDYELVGIVEDDAELRAKASNSEPYLGLPWMSREQLLNTKELQLVLVETKVRDLLDNAEACVSAGVHVHLDKPAGESLAHYERILKDAERQKLLVQMGYMYRYNPGFVLLRDLLKRGWLGEPFEVHAVMSKVVDPTSRRDLGRYRGGIMFEIGCHVIDQVVMILGAPEKITPYSRQLIASDDLVDNMFSVFEYPRATASVRSTALEVDGFARRHLVVCGTEGTFHLQPLDDPVARLALRQPRRDADAKVDFRQGYQELQFPKYVRYVDDARDIARVIRGESPPLASYAHDRNVQAAVLQASGL
ncbi:MAG: Gfo/Idh/MocA family oxidoreductase [Planctomycetes bacterium]|nr:Gfo/Idh/MocA family oxidoreductase [Planctomycetota bacterium]